MKSKILSIIFLFLAVTLASRAQQMALREASVSEVAGGRIGFPAVVTPRRLAPFLGGGTNTLPGMFNSDGTIGQLGYGAIGTDYGVAVGWGATAHLNGAAVGYQAAGDGSGVGFGYNARGGQDGTAIGNSAQGQNGGVAVGENTVAYGSGNVAIGRGADANSVNDFTDTTEIGAGTATVNGALHYRGNPVVSSNGNIIASVPSSIITGQIPTHLLPTQTNESAVLVPRISYVAGGTRLPQSKNTSNKYFQQRSAHITIDAVTNISVGFANFVGKTEAGSGSDSTICAALEYPSNTFSAFSFSGLTNGIITNGSFILTDFKTVNIPANTKFWVRSWYSNAAGIVYGDYSTNENRSEYSPTAIANKTMGGTIGTGPDNNQYLPCVILGTTTLKTVAVVGDSRDYGAGDITTDGTPYFGIDRLISPYYPTANLSFGANSFLNFNLYHTNLLELSKYATYIVSGMGINQLDVGLQTNMTYFAGLFGKPVYAETIPPATTSSDNWKTLGGQTLVYGSADTNRVNYNAALRAGAIAGVAGCIDIAAITESIESSGLWAVNGSDYYMTADGIHGRYYKILAESTGDFTRGRTWLSAKGGCVNGPVYASSTVTANKGFIAGNGSSAITRSITFTDTNIWDDINFSLSDLDPAGLASAPALTVVGNRLLTVFDTLGNDTSLVNFQMPHTWVTNTPVYTHFHYLTQDTSPITNVWEITYSTADIGQAYTNEVTVTNQIVVAGGTANKHVLVNVPTNGIPMTHNGPSTIGCTKFRLLSGNKDAYIEGFDVHYRVGGSQVPYNP